ncbi:MAG TPA: alpha/beta fold hydrolase [Flavihumibacter sp.]|jgi:pimeloyl-ACP methyl ester carboxylesterase
MNYRKLGKGKTVVLIHGFGEDSRIWDGTIEALQDKFQLIVPDLPGTGSSALEPGLSMESMATGIKTILDTEKISTATLLGHSMGGYISLAFAELYPDRLTALGLVHSSAYADSEAKKETRRKSIEFIRKQGSAAFLEASSPNLFAEQHRISMADTIKQLIQRHSYQQPEALIAFTEAMMARPDRTEILKKSKFPVLFIIGRHDQAVPFADSMQQVHLPELSYIYILEKSGHMGMLEEPSRFMESLNKFLSDLPR